MASLLKSNILYIGTTNVFNLFHVGMTFDGRDPYERWRKDAEYRKLPYLVERVEFYNICSDTDHPYHEWIRNDGILDLKKLGRSRSPEVFEVPGETHEECIANLKKSIENCLEYRRTGIRPFSKIFVPRPHQKWANQKILSMYNGQSTTIVPLHLCARFGKTLQALSLFKESGLDVMVVASYWLAANESFEKAVFQAYDIVSDVTIIKPDLEALKSALEKGKRVVIDVSLHQDAEKVDVNLINYLSNLNKLVYVDEADYGAWKNRSRNNIRPFIDGGNNLVCIATGTNIDRALIGSKGEIQDPIATSYLDMLEAKHGRGFLFEPGGICYDNPSYWMNSLSDIVQIACLTLQVEEDLVEELNQLSDEKRPNMTKIFGKRNSHIIRKVLRRLFFDEVFNTDIFGLYDTKYTPIEHPAAMMFIPGTTKDVDNIVTIGKQIAPHYNWIALHGDNKYTNRNAEKKVLDIIKNGGGERTVIVSCSMGSRSFSVPNIVAVVDCKDGGCIGAAVQEASRCFTPGCGKEVGLVVKYSFNSEKTSSFLTDLISSAINTDSSDTDSAIRRVHGLMDFLKKDEEGYLMNLTETDFLEYITSKENLNNMASSQTDIGGLISNIADLHGILQNISSNTPSKGSKKEWTGAIKKAISFIETEGKKEKEIDPENKAISDLIKKINTIVETSANTYYMAPYSNNFKDCLETIANNPYKNSEYTRLVGVGARTVLDHVYQYLPTKFMDMIIMKAEQFDAQDNFVSSTSKHSTLNLFNL